jgi:hypothetical protein
VEADPNLNPKIPKFLQDPNQEKLRNRIKTKIVRLRNPASYRCIIKLFFASRLHFILQVVVFGQSKDEYSGNNLKATGTGIMLFNNLPLLLKPGYPDVGVGIPGS